MRKIYYLVVAAFATLFMAGCNNSESGTPFNTQDASGVVSARTNVANTNYILSYTRDTTSINAQYNMVHSKATQAPLTSVGIGKITESQESFFLDTNKSVEIGSIIVYDRSNLMPHGALIEVTSLKTDSDENLHVTGKQAYLQDAFDTLSLHPAAKELKVTATSLSDTDSGDGISIKINETIKDEYSNVQATIDGNITLDIPVKVAMNISAPNPSWYDDWEYLDPHYYRLNSTSVTVTPDLSIGISATILKKITDKKTISLDKISIDCFDVQAGPVPIVFCPKIDLNLILSDTVSVELSTSYTAKHKKSYALLYKHDDGWSTAESPIINTHTFIKPQITGKENFTAGVQIMLDLAIYDVVGPTFSLEPYLELSMTEIISVAEETFSYDIDLGINAGIGYLVSILGDKLSSGSHTFKLDKTTLESGEYTENHHLKRDPKQDVVIDSKNDHMWNDGTEAYSTMGNYQGAANYCDNLGAAGYHDWRLPSTLEFGEIVGFSSKTPIDKSVFANVAFEYWSATEFGETENGSGVAVYGAVGVYDQPTSKELSVRCIRNTSQSHFSRDDSGIVTDSNTKYMWDDSSAPFSGTYKEAQEHCSNSRTGGYEDWIVPTAKNLSTLVNIDKEEIISSIFKNIALASFEGHNSYISADSDTSYALAPFPEQFIFDPGNIAMCVRGTNFSRDISNGIVTDSTTTLMWNDDISAKETQNSWLNAVGYCENLNLGNYSDWRLPNSAQFETITSQFKIENIFENYSANAYWSSTSLDEYLPNAEIEFLLLPDHLTVNTNKSAYHNIRCVRGDYASTVINTSTIQRDNSKEIVVDNVSGLIWNDGDDAKTANGNWDYAMKYCQDLDFAGYQNWRLPRGIEFSTIMDFKNKAPMGAPFENIVTDYWSSSQSSNSEAYMFVVLGKIGIVSEPKTSHLSIRCVRD